MQPVSMLMSNLNVEANTHHAPNALAAAQDTGQSQEIIREGIRIVQTVQASDAAAESQRVHRKKGEEEHEGQHRGSGERDTFTQSHSEEHKEDKGTVNETAPLIREKVKSRKSFEFLA